MMNSVALLPCIKFDLISISCALLYVVYYLVKFVILYIFYSSLFCYYVYLWRIKLIIKMSRFSTNKSLHLQTIQNIAIVTMEGE